MPRAIVVTGAKHPSSLSSDPLFHHARLGLAATAAPTAPLENSLPVEARGVAAELLGLEVAGDESEITCARAKLVFELPCEDRQTVAVLDFPLELTVAVRAFDIVVRAGQFDFAVLALILGQARRGAPPRATEAASLGEGRVFFRAAPLRAIGVRAIEGRAIAVDSPREGFASGQTAHVVAFNRPGEAI